METLHLNFWGPSSGAPAEALRGDCAEGSPHFVLIPAPRLPASRLFEGLAVDFSLFLVVLALAWLLGKMAAHEPTLNPAWSHDNITYDPRPAKKSRPDVSVSRVKRDEGRKLLLPLKAKQAIGAPALSAPTAVIEARYDLVRQIPAKGLPLLPMPAPAILPARMGSLETPVVPVPSLDPSPHYAAAFLQHGPKVGLDPLGPGGSTARLFAPSSSTEGIGGPPDLSAKPPRPAPRELLQPPREGFTKPEISVLPKPMYPPAALAARIEGDVILQVTFDKSGRVIFRRFIRQLQNAEMNSVARETVERIKFIPAQRDGVPVDSDSVITVFFRLTQLNLTATF